MPEAPIDGAKNAAVVSPTREAEIIKAWLDEPGHKEDPERPAKRMRMGWLAFSRNHSTANQWANEAVNRLADPNLTTQENVRVAGADGYALLGVLAAETELLSGEKPEESALDHFENARKLDPTNAITTLFTDTLLADLEKQEADLSRIDAAILTNDQKIQKRLLGIAIEYKNAHPEPETTEPITTASEHATETTEKPTEPLTTVEDQGPEENKNENEQRPANIEHFSALIEQTSRVRDAGPTALRGKVLGSEYQNFTHEGLPTKPDASWTKYDFSFIPDFTAAVEANNQQLQNSNVLLSYPSIDGKNTVFCYVMQQYQPDSLATKNGDPAVSFVFTLPNQPDASDRFINDVKTNPNLVDAIFQKTPLYQQLFGENKAQRTVTDRLAFIHLSAPPTGSTVNEATATLSQNLELLSSGQEKFFYDFNPPVGEATHQDYEANTKPSDSLMEYLKSDGFPLPGRDRERTIEEAGLAVDHAVKDYGWDKYAASSLFRDMVYWMSQQEGQPGREALITHFERNPDLHPDSDHYFGALLDMFDRVSAIKFPPEPPPLQPPAPEITAQEPSLENKLDRLLNHVTRVQYETPAGPDIRDVAEIDVTNPAEHNKYDLYDLSDPSLPPGASRAERLVTALERSLKPVDKHHGRFLPTRALKNVDGVDVPVLQLGWRYAGRPQAITVAFANQATSDEFFATWQAEPTKQEFLTLLNTLTTQADLPPTTEPVREPVTLAYEAPLLTPNQPEGEKVDVPQDILTTAIKDGEILTKAEDVQRQWILTNKFNIKEVSQFPPNQLYFVIDDVARQPKGAKGDDKVVRIVGGGKITDKTPFYSFEFTAPAGDARLILGDLLQGGDPAKNILQTIVNNKEPVEGEQAITVADFAIEPIADPTKHINHKRYSLFPSLAQKVKESTLVSMADARRGASRAKADEFRTRTDELTEMASGVTVPGAPTSPAVPSSPNMQELSPSPRETTAAKKLKKNNGNHGRRPNKKDEERDHIKWTRSLAETPYDPALVTSKGK